MRYALLFLNGVQWNVYCTHAVVVLTRWFSLTFILLKWGGCIMAKEKENVDLVKSKTRSLSRMLSKWRAVSTDFSVIQCLSVAWPEKQLLYCL